MDVYLKTKDPIEKAKRVQKKSAAAPGSHRPGGSDRATVGEGFPTGGFPTGEGLGLPTGGFPTGEGLGLPTWMGTATSPRPNQCMCHKVRKDSPWD